MHANPVTCSSLLCRLQHQEDVSVSQKQEKRKRRATLALDSPQKQNPSRIKKPNINPKQSEMHKPGKPVEISAVGKNHVCYKSHLITQKEHHRVECEYCGKCFPGVNILKRHRRIHTSSRAFQCEFCPKRFHRSDHLKSHRRVHTGEKPYKCTLCPKHFANHASLKYHLKAHAKSLVKSQNHEKKENGDKCKLDVTRLEVLSTNATTDTGTDEDEIVAPRTMKEIAERKKTPQLEETPKLSAAGYHCEYCSKVCKSASGHRNHQRSHFINECQFCGKIFQDANTLQDHFSEHHPEQEKLTHRCSDCLKCFPTAIALRGHMESSHSNQKECMCEWCGRTIRKSYLPEHYRIHQQIPHKCEFCGKTFIAPSYLRKHIRRCHKH